MKAGRWCELVILAWSASQGSVILADIEEESEIVKGGIPTNPRTPRNRGSQSNAMKYDVLISKHFLIGFTKQLLYLDIGATATVTWNYTLIDVVACS